MPTHAMKLHEWGTQAWLGFMYGPPTGWPLFPLFVVLEAGHSGCKDSDVVCTGLMCVIDDLGD